MARQPAPLPDDSSPARRPGRAEGDPDAVPRAPCPCFPAPVRRRRPRPRPALRRTDPRSPVHHLLRLPCRPRPDHRCQPRPDLRTAHRRQHRPGVQHRRAAQRRIRHDRIRRRHPAGPGRHRLRTLPLRGHRRPGPLRRPHRRTGPPQLARPCRTPHPPPRPTPRHRGRRRRPPRPAQHRRPARPSARLPERGPAPHRRHAPVARLVLRGPHRRRAARHRPGVPAAVNTTDANTTDLTIARTVPTGRAVALRGALAHWRQDLPASLVVFLVAVPLCVGVAVASGVPAERGLVTGIVGGLVVGLLPGSSLQVSGPAAGLTVLVFDAVQRFGLGSLGVLVLAAGLLQIAMGLLRTGRWFRAISVSVVHGMLAGIGLILILGQLYAVSGRTAPADGAGKLARLPALAGDWFTGRAATTALLMAAATVALLTIWQKLPASVRAVPAPLAAVALAAGATVLFGLDVPRVRVDGLLDAGALPTDDGLAAVVGSAGLGTLLAPALIASAEGLSSAPAGDPLPNRPRPDYDRDLPA